MTAPEAVDGSFAARTRRGVVGVELEGELVLLDEESGSLNHLDRVATIVWHRLDGSRTLDELALELSETFAVDRQEIRADLVRLVRDLLGRGLVEEAERGGHGSPSTG